MIEGKLGEHEGIEGGVQVLVKEAALSEDQADTERYQRYSVGSCTPNQALEGL